MNTDDELIIWTIYENPKDFPGWFVARAFKLGKPTDTMHKAHTLEGVRNLLPPGLVCLPLSFSDEPHIVECWI
jgi:hypothetical protein